MQLPDPIGLTLLILLVTIVLLSLELVPADVIASTAFFIPIVIGLAKRAGVSASKLLMPLAFASILTSSVTLVSTSTNMVVSGLMSRHGEPRSACSSWRRSVCRWRSLGCSTCK